MAMRRTKSKLASLSSLLATLAFASPIAVATPTDEDFARLQKQVEEQKRLTLQLMRVEQQHYDLLMELVQGGNRPTAGGAPEAPSLPATGAGDGEPAADAPRPAARTTASAATASAPAPRRIVERTATITGRVQVAGGSPGEIYVYVQNARAASARARTLSIEQKDKQFVPAVAVVQKGTTVSFPNRDAVFHNVFSPSLPHPFDLGSYRAGDAPRSVALTSPGVVVDVFCNIHSGMRAQILVVPNSLYTRVAADGSFRIENVPVGARKLVAWGPKVKIAQQLIEVAPSGAEVRFELTPEGAR